MSSLQDVRQGALDDVLALVSGRRTSRSLGGCLAPDVRTWLASPEQGVSGATQSVFGLEASIRALAGLAPSSLTMVASVRSDRAGWAEVARHGDVGPETCIVGLTYDPGHRVSRLVCLRARLVPPRRLDTGSTAPDARPVIENYFAALMNSRFRDAAAHFTADTLYSHPPYAGGAERVLFRGRGALAHGFETERGASPARQIVTDLWQRGSRAFVEGIVEGIPNGGSFFSTADISREGEIARYVAFYSATRIPGG
jgi:hypothetical protein